MLKKYKFLVECMQKWQNVCSSSIKKKNQVVIPGDFPEESLGKILEKPQVLLESQQALFGKFQFL